MTCSHCLEPIGEGGGIACDVSGVKVCAVCAARLSAEKVGFDPDLAQGIVATVLGESRGTAFMTSYARRQLTGIVDSEPSQPPLDPLVARTLGVVSDFTRSGGLTRLLARTVVVADKLSTRKKRSAKRATKKRGRKT